MIVKWLFGLVATLAVMFVVPAIDFGHMQGLSIDDMMGSNRLISADRAELMERCGVAFPGSGGACGCFVDHANAAVGEYTPNMSRDYVYDHIANGEKNMANANLLLAVDWSTVPQAKRDAARSEMQSFVKTCFGTAD